VIASVVVGWGRRGRRRACGAPQAERPIPLPPRQQVVPTRCAGDSKLAGSGYNLGAGRVSCSPSGAAGNPRLADPLSVSPRLLFEEHGPELAALFRLRRRLKRRASIEGRAAASSVGVVGVKGLALGRVAVAPLHRVSSRQSATATSRTTAATTNHQTIRPMVLRPGTNNVICLAADPFAYPPLLLLEQNGAELA
jgi:hypothetical protein